MLLETALARPLTGRGARGRIPPAPPPDVESPVWAPTDTADWAAVKAAVAAAGATAHLWTGEPGSLSGSADGAAAVGQGGRVHGIRDHFAPNDVTRRLRVWTPGSTAEHGGARLQDSGLDVVQLDSETWPGSYPTDPWRGYYGPSMAAPEGHIFWLLKATTSTGEEETFLQTAPFRVVKALDTNDIAIRGDGAYRYPMFTGFAGLTFLELRWSLPSTVQWRILDGDWNTIGDVIFGNRAESLYGVSQYSPFNYQPAPHGLGRLLWVDRLLPDEDLQPFRDHVLAGSGLTDTGPSEPSEPPPASNSNAGLISGITFTRTVNVANAAQLTTAFANAAAGDLIVLADGTYAGTFTTSVAGTAAAPIAVCAENDRVPVINGRIILNHGFNYVYALAFSSSQSEGNVLIDADDCRVLHCNFPSIGARGVRVARNQRKRFEIAYNYFNGGANPIQILITPNATQALNGWCHHNRIVSCSGSSIEMGTNETHSAVPVEMLVEYNLIETSGDNTALGFKCSSSVMHRNTLLNCGNANLQSRSGRNNKFIANACIGTGGCLLRGDGHLAIGNYKDDAFTGSWNDHTSPAGTMRQADFELGGFSGTQWPAGDNTTWIGNIPSVRIGGGSSTSTVVALNNRVEASPATLVSGKHSGTTTSPTTITPVPLYIILSSSMVGPGKSPVGPSYQPGVTVSAQAIFLNPFNKDSVHHRPIGAGATIGIPPGYNSSGTLVTAAVPNSRGRLSVVGDYRCSTGNNFFKYHYRNGSGIAAATRTIVRAPGTSDPDLPVTMRMPTGVFYPTSSGNDSNVGIFDDFDSQLYHLFFAFEDGTSQAEILHKYPLTGLDYPGSDPYPRGSSAGGFRWPGTILQDYEVAGENPGPIQHSLNVAVTRAQSGVPGSLHVLAPTRTWPAMHMDGSAASNQGDIPYGALARVTASGHATLLSSYTWTNRQRAILDCHRYYGVYFVDGNGVTTGGGSPQAVMQLRISGGFSSALRSEIDTALDRILPHLQFIANPRNYTTETERHSDGLCYRGGGGPIDANSVNSAYDA